MKVLITYYTMTNRTKKVAETMGKSLEGCDITYSPFALEAKRFVDKIKLLDKVEHEDFSLFEEKLSELDAQDYDLIVFGSPNYGNVAPKTIVEIIKRITNIDRKNVVVFVTGRFNGDKAMNTMKEMLEKKGATIVAEACYSRFLGIRKTDGTELAQNLL